MSRAVPPAMRRCSAARVGVVGTGRAAILHAEAARAAPGVELTGLASRDPASSAAVALAAGLGSASMGLRELARRCDAVVLATPPAVHAEAAVEVAASPRVRAVLVESPGGTTLDGVDALGAALAGRHVMAAVNLLHAPAVTRLLEIVAGMQPHHLELRASLPEPGRGPGAGSAFGGGVTVDPGAGLLPVLMAASGAAVQSVSVPEMLLVGGLDRAVEAVLRDSGGGSARISMRWDAGAAECAIEAADPDRVCRVEMRPAPSLEVDGASEALPLSSKASPLAALGFVAQMQRLCSVAGDRSTAWPGLDVSRSVVAVAVAAALSARRRGEPVEVASIPADESPHDILSG